MKIYKEYWNEEFKEVRYRELDIVNRNTSTINETNCTEFQHTYYDDEKYAIKGAASYNQDVKDGKLFFYKCKDCGIFFILTDEEKKWYTDRDMQIPKRCDSCRRKRRGGKNEST